MELIEIRKFADILVYIIRALSIVLIGINLIRLFEPIAFFDILLQDPGISLLNSLFMLTYSYFRSILRHFKIEIGELLFSLISLSALLTFIPGMIFKFFLKVPGYDSFAHFSNGALLVYIGITFLSIFFTREDILNLNPLFVIIFAFSFAAMLGVLWEILEYLSDLLFVDSNMQRYADIKTGNPFVGQAALRDTMKDFILNTLGGILASILIYKDVQRGSKFVSDLYIKRIAETDAKLQEV